MENLFLFLLRLSFLIPVLVGLVFSLQTRSLPLALTIILIHSILFGLVNTFHDDLIAYADSYSYFAAYTTLEFITFCFIIKLASNTIRPKLLLSGCTLVYTLSIIITIFQKNHEKADSLNIGIETILVSINIIYFFYLRFKKVDEQYLYQNPYFWLMTGMLVYLAFTFFFNILVNHVDNEVIKNYYHFSYIGDIIKNLLFAVAIWHLPRRSGSESRVQSFNAPKLDLI